MAMNINDLQFNIIYSKRKSIAIELRPDSILVRAPKGMSRREINDFINKKTRCVAPCLFHFNP